MNRVWGVFWGTWVISLTGVADLPNSRLRVNGMLHAGTTFELRANARVAHQLLALSEEAQVRVGQVTRWRWSLESPPGQSADRRSQSHPTNWYALFTLRLINEGNGWDRLRFSLTHREYAKPTAWGVELREAVTANWSSGRELQNGWGSPIAPAESMCYIVRMSPPSGATDGAWISVAATTSNNQRLGTLGEFTAGVLRDAWANAYAWCWREHSQLVAPALYQGRLFWMGTDTSRNETHIFYTRDPVDDTIPNRELGNERVHARTLYNFTPTGFSTVQGSSWFVGHGNQLVRIDLEQARLSNSASGVVSTVEFPSGVLPRLDLEPLVHDGLLYVAGSDRRLHAIRRDGVRTGQSAPMPSSYGAFSTNTVAIGRTLYIGTEGGWIVQFDAATGSLRTARRVSNQRIHSLAVTPHGRQLLARVDAREIVALNPNQLSLLWRRTLEEDIVSPVASSHEHEVAVIITRSGFLHAFSTRTGNLLPHYPQQIFNQGESLARASVALMRRADRQATYIYVLAQRNTGNTSPQALLRVVTLDNPYNRTEFNEGTMLGGSDYLPTILFSGNGAHSYCLVASRRASSQGGTVAGILLR